GTALYAPVTVVAQTIVACDAGLAADATAPGWSSADPDLPGCSYGGGSDGGSGGGADGGNGGGSDGGGPITYRPDSGAGAGNSGNGGGGGGGCATASPIGATHAVLAIDALALALGVALLARRRKR